MKKIYAEEFLNDPEGFFKELVTNGDAFEKAARGYLNRQDKAQVDEFIEAVKKDQFARTAFLPQYKSAKPELNGKHVDNKRKALSALRKLRDFNDEMLISRIDEELAETETLLLLEINLNDLLKTGGRRYELFVGDLAVLASLVRIYESSFPHLKVSFEGDSLFSLVASALTGRDVPEKTFELIELYENFLKKNH